jgi:hypothetical protein
MRSAIKSLFRPFALLLRRLGFDPGVILSFKHYPLYKKQKKEWLKSGGKITHTYMLLSDYSDKAGSAKGHYFHQDLLVANFIFENNPPRHIDVGSRIDGFVAHVASFRKIEVIDIRPLAKSEHANIEFRQGDLMNPTDVGMTESLSCLHAIEHFGLGRYGDPIDVNGHKKGIDNLIKLVKKGGRFYISFPIGQDDEVHFNAHRVFHPKSILSIPSVSKNMRLVRFDFIDDNGDLHLDASTDDAVGKTRFGCGIYTFEKIV